LNKRNAALFFFSINLALLVGCAPLQKMTLSDARGRPLSGDAIKATISGRSFPARNFNGQSYTIEYGSDGTTVIDARPFFFDEGRWWVENELLCEKWKTINKGRAFCVTAIRDGKKINLFRPDSGKRTVEMTDTQELDVEKIKKLKINLEAPTFTSAPRGIDGILRRLDFDDPAERERNFRAEEIANRPPPDTRDAVTLAVFYWERAAASRQLGRTEQEIEDSRLAAQFSDFHRYPKAANLPGLMGWNIKWDYGDALIRSGDSAKGFEILEGVVGAPATDISIPTAQRSSHKGFRLVMSGFLAAWQAASYQIEKAEENLRYVESRIASGSRSAESQSQRIFTVSHAVAKAGILTASGELKQAEELYKRAISAQSNYNEWKLWPGVTRENMARTYYLLHFSLANNLRRQGRFAEGEAAVRTAIDGYLRVFGKKHTEIDVVLIIMAEILGDQGRSDDALRLIRSIVHLQDKRGEVSQQNFYALVVRLSLAGVLATKGKCDEALKIFSHLETSFPKKGRFGHLLRLNGIPYGECLLRVGKPRDALRHFSGTMDYVKRLLGSDHYLTAEAIGYSAIAHAAIGDHKTAQEGFKSSLALLAPSFAGLGETNTEVPERLRRLRQIVEAYLRSIETDLTPGTSKSIRIPAIEAVFKLTDVIRSSSVSTSIQANAARWISGKSELATLVRKEQDISSKIRALFERLNHEMEDPRSPAGSGNIGNIKKEIQQLRITRSAVRDTISRRYPRFKELTSPQQPRLTEVAKLLGDDEAMISIYVGSERTYAIAIDRAGNAYISVVSVPREQMVDKVAVLRESLDPGATELGDIPAFDLPVAYSLYETLLEPLEGIWKTAKSLLIVPHGPLGYLPFSVLPTKLVKLAPLEGELFSNYRAVPWLTRSHSITVLPSVSSLKTLREIPPGSTSRKSFAGFGDPVFNQAQMAERPQAESKRLTELGSRRFVLRSMPLHLRAAPKTAELESAGLNRLPRLPDTADEIRGIATALRANPVDDVFLGKRANELLVKSIDLSRYKVLSFATHGLIPGDLDGLTQPALALSLPGIVGDTENDGLLTMGEILGLKLDADWVVLSACNTASGDGAGAEAVSGLGRAFFYAGTRALLVSNWPVHSESTAELMTNLFSLQGKDRTFSRAEALHLTLSTMIDRGVKIDERGRAVFAYAHPIFWAPFIVVGEGGPGRQKHRGRRY
jgi:CHAT domain-containing protein